MWVQKKFYITDFQYKNWNTIWSFNLTCDVRRMLGNKPTNFFVLNIITNAWTKDSVNKRKSNNTESKTTETCFQ